MMVGEESSNDRLLFPIRQSFIDRWKDDVDYWLPFKKLMLIF